jgi:hypothetical protein
MKRSLALGLGAAAVLAVVGCSQNGSYRLSWIFQVEGATVSPAVACGRYYVDSILLSGSDGSGDLQQVRAPCTPGSVTSTAPDGTWSFQVQMLDAQGALVQSTMTTPPTDHQSISSDGPSARFSVILYPKPASSGGTDGGTDAARTDGGRTDGGLDMADSGPDDASNGAHD